MSFEEDLNTNFYDLETLNCLTKEVITKKKKILILLIL